MTPAYACNQTDYPGNPGLAKLHVLVPDLFGQWMPMDATAQMVLANRLTDGHTVFLTADGGWVEDIGAGAVVGNQDAAQQLLAAAQLAEARNAVVEPYLIAIRIEAGLRVPVSYREAIRAAGPTVRTDLAE